MLMTHVYKSTTVGSGGCRGVIGKDFDKASFLVRVIYFLVIPLTFCMQARTHCTDKIAGKQNSHAHPELTPHPHTRAHTHEYTTRAHIHRHTLIHTHKLCILKYRPNTPGNTHHTKLAQDYTYESQAVSLPVIPITMDGHGLRLTSRHHGGTATSRRPGSLQAVGWKRV